MKILIVKTSSIGDVLQTLPLLQYLQSRYPNAQIDWVVEKGVASLVQAHPLVNKTIVLDTKQWRKNTDHRASYKEAVIFLTHLRQTRYDLLFDLQGNIKSGMITFAAHAKEKIGFGYHSLPEKLNLLSTHKRYEAAKNANVRQKYLSLLQSHFQDNAPFFEHPIKLNISTEEQHALEQILDSLPTQPIFMVCFGSRWRNKQLTEETLLSFLQGVSEKLHPFFLFVYAGEEEERLASKLQEKFSQNSRTIGALTLPLWQAVIYQVQMVVCVDSAALHLAGTTTTPSFSIFGPSQSHIYKPAGKQHAAYQGVCPYSKSFTHRCAILRSCPTGACIRSSIAKEVEAQFLNHVQLLKS